MAHPAANGQSVGRPSNLLSFEHLMALQAAALPAPVVGSVFARVIVRPRSPRGTCLARPVLHLAQHASAHTIKRGKDGAMV